MVWKRVHLQELIKVKKKKICDCKSGEVCDKCVDPTVTIPLICEKCGKVVEFHGMDLVYNLFEYICYECRRKND